MARDRRGTPRTAVAFNAVLNYDAHAVICTIKDISVDGAFIETDPSELPLRRSVELGMSVQGEKGGMRHYRLPVLIRRVTDGGAGVSFSEMDRDSYFDLVELVYHA